MTVFFKIREAFRGKGTICFLAGISFIYYAAGIYQGLDTYDEGFTVYGATRVLNGEIPYRDFIAQHAPGIYYLQAGAFSVFGSSIVVERILSSLFLAALSLLVYLIAGTFVSRKYAALAWLLCLIENIYWDYATSGVPAMCLFLLSVLLLLKYLADREKRSLLFLSGLALGIGTVFRHDYGIYAFMAETLLLVLFTFLNPVDSSRSGSLGRGFDRLTHVFPYFLGIGVIILPILFWLFSVVPRDDLYYSFIVYPRDIYRQFRGLPYPSLFPSVRGAFSSSSSLVVFGLSVHHAFLYYLPLAVYVLVAIMLVRRASGGRGWAEEKANWQILLILFMGIVFLSSTRFRSDRVHGLPTFAFATVLFSMLLSCAPSGKGIRHVRAIAIVLALTFMFEPLANRLITLRESLVLSRRQAFDLERSKGVYCGYGIYQDAVEYIQEKVPETGRIFVGNSRHDKIHVADIIFYFLADRHSATKFDLLHPGITTTLEVQTHIIEDIERFKVPYVVLWDWDAGYEPNAAAGSSGVTVLDDFIRDQYVPDRQFGAYHVWKRNTS